MGVCGLSSFVFHNGYSRRINLKDAGTFGFSAVWNSHIPSWRTLTPPKDGEEQQKILAKRPIVIVDGYNLSCTVFSNEHDYFTGPKPGEMRDDLERILTYLQDTCKFELHVVFDSAQRLENLETWLKSRKETAMYALIVKCYILANKGHYDKAFGLTEKAPKKRIIPLFNVIGVVERVKGITLYRARSDADRFIMKLADELKAEAILSQDSDFYLYPYESKDLLVIGTYDIMKHMKKRVNVVSPSMLQTKLNLSSAYLKYLSQLPQKEKEESCKKWMKPPPSSAEDLDSPAKECEQLDENSNFCMTLEEPTKWTFDKSGLSDKQIQLMEHFGERFEACLLPFFTVGLIGEIWHASAIFGEDLERRTNLPLKGELTQKMRERLGGVLLSVLPPDKRPVLREYFIESFEDFKGPTENVVKELSVTYPPEEFVTLEELHDPKNTESFISEKGWPLLIWIISPNLFARLRPSALRNLRPSSQQLFWKLFKLQNSEIEGSEEPLLDANEIISVIMMHFDMKYVSKAEIRTRYKKLVPNPNPRIAHLCVLLNEALFMNANQLLNCPLKHEHMDATNYLDGEHLQTCYALCSENINNFYTTAHKWREVDQEEAESIFLNLTWPEEESSKVLAGGLSK